MKRFVLTTVVLLLAGGSFLAKSQPNSLPKIPDTPKYTDFSLKNSGYWFSVAPGVAVASRPGFESSGCAQLELSNGYRFSEFFKLGIGIAPRMYFCGYLDKKYSLPLFAEARGNFFSQYHTAWAPWWNANVGYSFNEGTFFTVGVGARFGGLRHNFITSVFYSLQGVEDEQLKFVHMLGIKLGYEF